MKNPDNYPSDPRLDPELALEHSEWLKALSLDLVRDSAVASDLAEDAMRALAAASGRVGNARGFLSGTVRHLAAKFHRGEGRRRQRERAMAREAPTSVPSTGSLVERIDTLRVLMEELGSLSEPQQEAIALRYLDGLSPAEIAARSGIPAATVRSHIARGLALLRERLDSRLGSRDGWCAVLIPWVGSSIDIGLSTGGELHVPGGAVSRASAALAPVAAATTIGVVVMSLKIVAIAVVPLVAVAFWWRLDPIEQPHPDLSVSSGAARSLADAAPSVPVEDPAQVARLTDLPDGDATRKLAATSIESAAAPEVSPDEWTGTIVDRLTGEPVPDYSVMVHRDGQGEDDTTESITDSEGRFQLDAFPAGHPWHLTGVDRHGDQSYGTPEENLDESALDSIAVRVGPTFQLQIFGGPSEPGTALSAYMTGPGLTFGHLLRSSVRDHVIDAPDEVFAPDRTSLNALWVRLPAAVTTSAATPDAEGPFELHVVRDGGLAEGVGVVRRVKGIEPIPVAIELEPRSAIEFVLPMRKGRSLQLHTVTLRGLDMEFSERLELVAEDELWSGSVELLKPGRYRWTYGIDASAQEGTAELAGGVRSVVPLAGAATENTFDARVFIDASLAPEAVSRRLISFQLHPVADATQRFVVRPQLDSEAAPDHWQIDAEGMAAGEWVLQIECPDDCVAEPERLLLAPGAPSAQVVIRPLAPPVNIGLTVVDASTGDPIPGAHAFHMIGTEWAVLHADDQGRLPSHPVPSERSTAFLVQAPGYGLTRATVPANSTSGAQTVELTRGWRSRVSISDAATGLPVAGVAVEVDGRAVGTSDDEGEVWLDGTAAPHRIAVLPDPTRWEVAGRPEDASGDLPQDPPVGYLFKLRPR